MTSTHTDGRPSPVALADATPDVISAAEHGAAWAATPDVLDWVTRTASGGAGWVVGVGVDPATTGRVRGVYVAAYARHDDGGDADGQAWWAWLPTTATEGPITTVVTRAVLAVLAGRATPVPEPEDVEWIRETAAALLDARGVL